MACSSPGDEQKVAESAATEAPGQKVPLHAAGFFFQPSLLTLHMHDSLEPPTSNPTPLILSGIPPNKIVVIATNLEAGIAFDLLSEQAAFLLLS